MKVRITGISKVRGEKPATLTDSISTMRGYEKMIPGTVVTDNELSDAHRSAADDRKDNITTGITVVPTIVNEAPELVMYKEIHNEGQPEPLLEEGNVNAI